MNDGDDRLGIMSGMGDVQSMSHGVEVKRIMGDAAKREDGVYLALSKTLQCEKKMDALVKATDVEKIWEMRKDIGEANLEFFV